MEEIFDFILVIFDASDEKMMRKYIVWTLRDIYGWDVREGIHLSRIRAPFEWYVSTHSSGDCR